MRRRLDHMRGVLFSDVADLFKKKYGERCYVSTNRQEVRIFEAATGRVWLVTLTEVRTGPSS